MIASFEDQVVAFCCHHRLVPPGSNIMVAVSGGPDSCALFLALASRRKQLAIKRLAAVYVDHGFRAAGPAEAAFVKKLAESQNAEFYSGRLNLTHGAADEERARAGRYELLKKIAGEQKFDLIALAHHQDDLVETMLINLTRGSGLSGLKGIVPKRDIYIRPLLNQRRGAIEEYCAARKITPLIDPTNLGCAYLRNRIRLKLLPLWQEIGGRDIVPVLARNGEIMGSEEEFLEELTQETLSKIICTEEPLKLDLPQFLALHPAMQGRVARAAISRALKRYYRPSFEQTTQFLAAARAGRGLLWLPDQLLLSVDAEFLTLAKRGEITAAAPKAAASLIINEPGRHGFNNVILAIYQSSSLDYKNLDQRQAVCFKATEIKWPLTIRPVGTGDRLTLFGHKRPVKVSEIMSDLKIPASSRPKQLVLLDAEGKILWLIGHKRSAMAPVKDDDNILMMEIINE